VRSKISHNKSRSTFVSVHTTLLHRSRYPLNFVGPVRLLGIGTAAKTERVRRLGSVEASAVGCAPVPQRGSIMGVDGQLLTGLWHARSRPGRSRASRAASCRVAGRVVSREPSKIYIKPISGGVHFLPLCYIELYLYGYWLTRLLHLPNCNWAESVRPALQSPLKRRQHRELSGSRHLVYVRLAPRHHLLHIGTRRQPQKVFTLSVLVLVAHPLVLPGLDAHQARAVGQRQNDPPAARGGTQRQRAVHSTHATTEVGRQPSVQKEGHVGLGEICIDQVALTGKVAHDEGFEPRPLQPRRALDDNVNVQPAANPITITPNPRGVRVRVKG